jgi:hypothetical protein
MHSTEFCAPPLRSSAHNFEGTPLMHPSKFCAPPLRSSAHNFEGTPLT